MKSRNLISVVAVLFAAFALAGPTRAQSIDYGMIAGLVQSPAGTDLVGGGFQLLGVTPGSGFNPSAASLADLLNSSNMLSVSNSLTSIDAANPGQFYQDGLLTFWSTGATIASGTQLYLLASTSLTFDLSAPWALVTGTAVGWFSPNPTDPFGYSNIELSLAGNTIIAAGFGGPGVGAYFDPPSGGNLILVPEPSTYALILMSAAGALWWARRRRYIGGKSVIAFAGKPVPRH